MWTINCCPTLSSPASLLGCFVVACSTRRPDGRRPRARRMQPCTSWRRSAEEVASGRCSVEYYSTLISSSGVSAYLHNLILKVWVCSVHCSGTAVALLWRPRFVRTSRLQSAERGMLQWPELLIQVELAVLLLCVKSQASRLAVRASERETLRSSSPCLIASSVGNTQ